MRAGLLVVLAGAVPGIHAAESGGDLRAATQNPISSMYGLPFKFVFDNDAPNGDSDFLIIQPVLPVTVGDWNLVSRIIIPVASSPGGITGLPGNPGVGDPTMRQARHLLHALGERLKAQITSIRQMAQEVNMNP